MHSRRKPKRALRSAAWREKRERVFAKKKRGVRRRGRGDRARSKLPCEDEKIDQRAAFFSSFPSLLYHQTTGKTHLVVASNQMHRGRVLDLQREQQADGLERVRAAVDIVAEEKIVDVRDVPSGAGRAILLEKAHQVTKLAVQVSEDLDGR